jgi:membrane protease YdiL (CAAX protease family)
MRSRGHRCQRVARSPLKCDLPGLLNFDLMFSRRKSIDYMTIINAAVTIHGSLNAGGGRKNSMALPTQPLPAVRFAPAAAVEKRGYLKESQQPIYSALIVLPFLLVYEIGVVVLRSDVINGGQAIIKQLGAPVVQNLGVSGSLISLVFIVAAFLVWQIRRKGTWKVQPPVLAAMSVESLFFAVILFLILRMFVHYVSDDPRPVPTKRHASIQNPSERKGVTCESSAPCAVRAVGPQLVPCAVRSNVDSGPELRDFVLYCGAGVYEELVFRVMLLGLLVLVMTRLMHMEHAYAWAWAVVVGSIVFSAYHHIGEKGDRYEFNVFLQRLLCGLYFSALYYTRSFGVAAASHAMYDILIGLNRMNP